MDVVKDITKDGRPVTLVATGDGTTEFSKLGAFSKHYNGKKVLWFPEKPKYAHFSRRSHFQNQRIGGLDVLEVLTVYPGAYKLHRYLFIIDREHFGGNPTNDIIEKLNRLRIVIESIEELSVGAFYIFCNYGSHELGVYIAISGKERCIEEDLAMLIKLEYGSDVQPTKNDIRRFLRSTGLKDKELIRNATKTNLRKAFPNLSSALMRIEKNNSES
ncbi:MAG: hypothetical protein ISS94_00310 [Candidatus Syntrophoarchaeum sp.]|nr:hypothetical protein [Candidatus Syntrophoarchaeum sp.]